MTGYAQAVRLALAGLVAGIACAALGCAPLGEAPPRPPRADVPYGRVAVVEFTDETRYQPQGYAAELSRGLVEKLAAWTVDTDVLYVSARDLPGDERPIHTGSLPLRTLVEVRRLTQAELAVIGSLQAMDPYRPPSAQLAVKVVSTTTGEVLFSHADTWDAEQREVLDRMEAYCRLNRESADCRFGAELILDSPRFFLRFVADEVAYSLAQAIAVKAQP